MTGHVHVIVTNKSKGQTSIAPYSHASGLQFAVVNGIRTDKILIYTVPYYEVRIDKGGSYKAVRFGLQNDGTVAKVRQCDAGLSMAQVCTPSWIPTYSPHSFDGTARAGAWQLLPGKGFLIHEGADTRANQVGGSLGCIEILDGRWNAFLSEIETLAKTKAQEVGKSRLMKVTIEAAPYPTATLAS